MKRSFLFILIICVISCAAVFYPDTVQAQTKTMEQAQRLREANPPKAVWDAFKKAWYYVYSLITPTGK